MQRLSESQCTSWAKLHQRKVRKNLGQCLVEGERSVQQVLENQHLDISHIVVSLEGGENPSPERIASLVSMGVKEESICLATPRQCKKLSDTPSPQSLFALVSIPVDWDVERGFEILAQQPQSLVLILDDIQDPGNMGTILRTASWFGVDAVLCTPGCVDPWNSKVVRALSGAMGVIPIAHVAYDWVSSLPSSHTLFGLDLSENAIPIERAQWDDHSILAIGNEGNGLSASTRDALQISLHISPNISPMQRTNLQNDSTPISPKTAKKPLVESLNAAVATSIALYSYRSVHR